MRATGTQSVRSGNGAPVEEGSKGFLGWRLGAGYRLKPAEERERISMASKRPSGERFEIRLGPIQVLVWIGMALGSIFGAYGLGFVSGKSVGFDSARTASGSEVAKLAISDALPESPEQNVSGIYDRLNAPAVLQRGLDRGSDTSAGGAIAPAKPVRDPTVEKVKQIQEQGSSAVVAAPQSGEEASSLEEIENIFKEEAVVAGVAPADAKGVRILGGGQAAGAIPSGAAKPSDKTVGALLDERLREAAPPEGDMGAIAVVPAQRRGDSVGKPVEAPASRIPVTKKLKKGYYAQVQAPKSVDEAEQVARKLRDSGFPVVIESAGSGSQSFYRVLVGPEEKKVQAERLIGQLKSEKYIKGSPFLKPAN